MDSTDLLSVVASHSDLDKTLKTLLSTSKATAEVLAQEVFLSTILVPLLGEDVVRDLLKSGAAHTNLSHLELLRLMVLKIEKRLRDYQFPNPMVVVFPIAFNPDTRWVLDSERLVVQSFIAAVERVTNKDNAYREILADHRLTMRFDDPDPAEMYEDLRLDEDLSRAPLIVGSGPHRFLTTPKRWIEDWEVSARIHGLFGPLDQKLTNEVEQTFHLLHETAWQKLCETLLVPITKEEQDKELANWFSTPRLQGVVLPMEYKSLNGTEIVTDNYNLALALVWITQRVRIFDNPLFRKAWNFMFARKMTTIEDFAVDFLNEAVSDIVKEWKRFTAPRPAVVDPNAPPPFEASIKVLEVLK